MRRCIGCMKSRPKQELNRYTLKEDGYILDEKYLAPGRGIYVCKGSEECLKKAKKRYKLEEKI